MATPAVDKAASLVYIPPLGAQGILPRSNSFYLKLDPQSRLMGPEEA